MDGASSRDGLNCHHRHSIFFAVMSCRYLCMEFESFHVGLCDCRRGRSSAVRFNSSSGNV